MPYTWGGKSLDIVCAWKRFTYVAGTVVTYYEVYKGDEQILYIFAPAVSQEGAKGVQNH